jgi:hypothetical protein
MSITSPASDDECGDAKQIRLETTHDKTPQVTSDDVATTCWKPAPISTECLKQQHNGKFYS